jgi:hypothetical protein
MSLYSLDVHEDPWHWQIWHRDDYVVDEYCEETGLHRNFALELATAPVRMVALIPQVPGLQPIYLPISEGMRPIVFRTRSVVAVLDPNAPIPEPDPRQTFIGWQKTVQGENVQSLICLYDDGSQVVTDDRKKV